MTSMSTTKVVLRQPEDWEAWKIKLAALLKRKGCYVAISEPEPQVPATLEQQERAYGYIVDTIDKELLPVIGIEENPRTIIANLRNYLFINSGSNKSAIYRELWGMELGEGDAADKMFTRIDVLEQRLAAQGETLSDGEKLSAARKALPKSFFALAAQLDAREAMGDALTYAQMRAATRLFETNLAKEPKAEEKALTAKDGKQRDKRKDKCFKCGKLGHYAQECRGGKPTGQEKSCWNCGKPGHVKRDCRGIKKQDEASAFMAQAREPAAFVLDTGASSHIVKSRDYMASARDTTTLVQGLTGKVRAVAIGTLKDFPGQALHVPDARENLLSIRQLTNNGWTAAFANDNVTLTAQDGRTIRGLHDAGNLFVVDETCYIATTAEERGAADMMLWHRRLGHLGEKRLRDACDGQIDTSSWPACLSACKVCTEAKLTRARVTRTATHAEADAQLAKGERVDVDLIGPMPASHSGYKYALEAVDRSTRMSWKAYIKTKDQAAAAMAQILDKEFSPFGRHCDRLHGDRGGEFTGKDWLEMCRERRIRATFAATATPEHNGLVERTHGTTVGIARAMLIDAGLDDKWWVEALNYATLVHNVTPTAGLPGSSTPYEAWTGEKPKIDTLKVFGSRVYYLAPGGRFGKKAQEGIYVGPALNTTGGAARVYCPSTRRVIVTRDIKVIEAQNTLFVALEPTAITDQETESDSDESEDEGIVEGPVRARRPEPRIPAVPEPERQQHAEPQVPATPMQGNKRPVVMADITPAEQRTGEAKRLQFSAGAALGTDQLPAMEGIATRRRTRETQQQREQALIAVEVEPRTYQEAIARPDANEWITSLRDELQSLDDQKVWNVVEREPDTRCVTAKWVFKVKTDENNVPVRYKSRLAARGFTQVPGVDFEAVSAPVVSKEAVRTALALACQRGWYLEQFDVKTAYLYAELDKTIHMEAPEGLLDLWQDRLSPQERQLLQAGRGVLRLNKALYGLKQSGRRWYETIKEYLHDIDFTATQTEPCIFVGPDNMILLLYVDDGIIIGPDQQHTDRVASKIAERFDIKRLGYPRHFLGWGISQHDGNILVSQRGYVEAMADAFSVGDYSKATPMIYGAALPDEGPAGDDKIYREMIGSLLFAAVGTRPDIATATSILSRNMAAPTKAHIKAARTIVGYAAATSDYCLRYAQTDNLHIEVYCDASFAPDEHNRKSRTGWVVLVNGAPVAWKSTLQRQIAHSTAEAEYISLSDAAREATYIKQLLGEMGHEINEAIIVYEDNQTAKIMAEEVATKRSKHIDIRYHHVRELVGRGTIKIEECRTSDMVADLLTKPLPKEAFIKHRDRIMAKGEC